MRHENSVFHQLTKHIPWPVFDAAVRKHGADHRVRRLRTRDQFLALLFGQLSGARSLREIEHGLASHHNRLYHAGMRGVSRSTLSDANARRPAAVYETVFAEMVRRARPGLRRKLRAPVRLLDATKLKLNDLSADWARFSAAHNAAKLHVVFDPEANLVLRAEVTPDTVNDITPARAIRIEGGATYVFDMAYYSFPWWAELHARNCRFVTRRKSRIRLRDRRERPVAQHGGILSDATGLLSRRLKSTGGRNPFVAPVREVVVARDGKPALHLLTNDLEAPAEEIARLYKQRWEVELLFKWLKQNLSIRRFIGTSENAVRTQVFIALIAFMILRSVHQAQDTITSMQHFARLISLNIMHRRDPTSLRRPTTATEPDRRQATLQFT